jgi:predicted component of type VI protein secretion system
VLEPVSVALKFGFLAVLYLFLLWIVRSSLRELRRSGSGAGPDIQPAAVDATGMYSVAQEADEAAEPQLVVERAPGHEAGMAYDLGDGATLGRGDVEIHLDDPFASSRHARIFRQGHVYVLEDLGSTNGTYLNDEPLNGPQPLHPGDRIRIGDSEFSYAL